MQTINWQPFSRKHKEYIRKGLESKMSVAEGSVRAGKTIDNCILACAYLETSKDMVHLATGSTIANAKMNIGFANGFGLECLFKGRSRWGKFKDNEALFIKTKTGEKIVVFAGGGKADSYKKILGNSYGLWIATEINEHYDCDNSKESFIKVAMARQLASKQPKILWDLNPCSPNHRIYAEYIDRYQQEGLTGGYNYGHFTIADNLSISDEAKQAIIQQYGGINTVWYKRDILGMRCVAEGNVYQDFADNTSKYLLTAEQLRQKQIVKINIGIDFGGNKSANTFVATGFTQGFREVIVLEAEREEGKTTPAMLEEKLAIFLEKIYTKYGLGGNIYCDSAEQTLIGGIRGMVYRRGLPFGVNNAFKHEIKERIRLVLSLMSQGRFFVRDHCATVIKALSEAVYNSKAGHEDERLDDFTSDIDTLDGLEYSVEPHLDILKWNYT